MKLSPHKNFSLLIWPLSVPPKGIYNQILLKLGGYVDTDFKRFNLSVSVGSNPSVGIRQSLLALSPNAKLEEMAQRCFNGSPCLFASERFSLSLNIEGAVREKQRPVL
jgi:hypothetical protein